MEEREMEKNSLFATLSKPENKELKGFLKIYIIIFLVNFVVFIIAKVLFFLTDEVELYSRIFSGLVSGLMLFNFILCIFLIPQTYRFWVKFLIPKIFKDLNKELNFENSMVKFLAPKILEDLSKEMNLEELKKELKKELIKELEKNNKKKIT